MDNLMVFDEQAKRRIGIINFLPAIAFLSALIYYLFLLSPTFGRHEPGAASGITVENYGTLFAMLAVAGILSAGILIYNLVLLAKVKNMNAQDKIIWILLLATFVPIAFILFWAFVVRKEPKYVGTYPDIA